MKWRIGVTLDLGLLALYAGSSSAGNICVDTRPAKAFSYNILCSTNALVGQALHGFKDLPVKVSGYKGSWCACLYFTDYILGVVGEVISSRMSRPGNSRSS